VYLPSAVSIEALEGLHTLAFPRSIQDEIQKLQKLIEPNGLSSFDLG
jgi:hypothetical protein